MQSVIQGKFRTVQSLSNIPININDVLTVSDFGGAGSSASWTPGATLIDVIPTQPALGQSWKIIGWAISYIGAILTGSSAGGHEPPIPHGKLGSIFAGLVESGQPSPLNASGQPFYTTVQPFPNDLTTFKKVWDGENDTPFPLFDFAVPFPFGTPLADQRIDGLVLPLPIDWRSGQQYAFGIWITPSLTLSAAPAVVSALYTVIYDDGR